MRRLLGFGLSVLLTLAAPVARSQAVVEIPTSEYLRLLQATRYIDNYKEMAAVSAEVFGARRQGSDEKYAQLMSVVATADLSDIDGCLIAVYKTQDLTQRDITTLISIFESPLGAKVLAQSQRMLIADIRRGSHQPLSLDAFTEDEKRGLLDIQQNPSFRTYSMMVSNRSFAVGMLKCIVESAAVKKAGIAF